MDKIIKSEEKFRKIYCEQNKIFNIIINWNWFITGVVVGLFSTFLGIFVQKGATLGYIGFGVGVLLDYFMRKNYLSELEKFRQGRSLLNLETDDWKKMKRKFSEQWVEMSTNIKVFFICMGICLILGLMSSFAYELYYVAIGFGIAGWISFFLKWNLKKTKYILM